MADFGGEMRFSFNGRPLKLRAALKLSPTNLTFGSVINQDNSVSRTLTPKAFTGEVTFEDTPGTEWDAILRGGPYSVSVVEDATGRLHQWTGFIFQGEPMIDRATGAVEGLTFVAESYRSVEA